MSSKEYFRGYYHKHRDEKLAAARERSARPEVKERRKVYRASRRGKDKAWKKEWDLKRAYGITLEQRDVLLTSQGNTCALCTATTAGKNDWHVDHNHETGRVRGVLCCRCNLMLGQARDNPELLRRGAEYLEVHDGSDSSRA